MKWTIAFFLIAACGDNITIDDPIPDAEDPEYWVYDSAINAAPDSCVPSVWVQPSIEECPEDRCTWTDPTPCMHPGACTGLMLCDFGRFDACGEVPADWQWCR